MTCETCIQAKTKRAPHRRKHHKYAPSEAFCSDILAPIRTERLNEAVKGPENRTQQELYFITFTDVATRYAYVTRIRSRDKTQHVIDQFLSTFAQKWGKTPTWLITDNTGEYTSQVVMDILGDMDIVHVQTIDYNPEDNGISEWLNLTIMNAVRAALKTADLDWTYWIYALADVVDKYNQIPHSATGQSPHSLWFGEKADLRALFVFGQYGYVPVMRQPKKKLADRGQRVRDLRRDGEAHVLIETDQQEIKRFRAEDFKLYHSYREGTQRPDHSNRSSGDGDQ